MTDSLSLKNWKFGSLSAMMTLVSDQVWPPSLETAAPTALLLLLVLLNEIDTV